MKRLFALLRATRAAVRASLMIALAYPASILAEFVGAIAHIAGAVAPLFFVYHYREGIAGWNRDEGLLVLGAFVLLEGLVGAVVEPNLRAIVEHVRLGTLDFVLLKPIDAQWFVSIQRTAPARLPDALAGAALLVFAASRLPTPPGALSVLLCVLLLASGFLIIHALWMFVASLSFFFVRVDNLSWLIRALLDAGRWPLPFYRGGVRVLFTVVLPVGLMTTWPAEALRGSLAPTAVAQALLTAGTYTLLARLAWVAALRHYSSASS